MKTGTFLTIRAKDWDKYSQFLCATVISQESDVCIIMQNRKHRGPSVQINSCVILLMTHLNSERLMRVS